MVSLRDYLVSDFNAIWSLDQACFASGIAYSKREMQRYLALPGGFAIIAEAGTHLAGFILCHVGRTVGYIITIDIDSTFRRHNVGSQLMFAAQERMRSRNARSVYLEVAVDNQAAIAFYRRHGYEVMKVIPKYYNNSLDAYKMAKKLEG